MKFQKGLAAVFLLAAYYTTATGQTLSLSVPKADTVGRSMHRPAADSANSVPPLRSIVLALPPNIATQHYGFFCRQELKWDKVLPFQLRLRVGSHDACDQLEEKRE